MPEGADGGTVSQRRIRRELRLWFDSWQAEVYRRQVYWFPHQLQPYSVLEPVQSLLSSNARNARNARWIICKLV
ncbi:hypothetical protein XpopCFBP1817_18230, partial [Xanthomonas populi]